MNEPVLQFDVKAELEKLSPEALQRIVNGGSVVTENLRLLKKSAQNPVGQCLAHQGTFYEEEHFPKGDVYDAQSHSQYYYHAHRPESGEHGHFHTFLRAKGMRKSTKPAPYKGQGERPLGKDALSHIVAISMNRPGLPIGLFTTNRWVTGETFYGAGDVIDMLDRFEVEQSYPCLATNRFLTGMMQLFAPQIAALLEMRDETINSWAENHPDRDVFEDRELEITSILEIDIDRQISAANKELESRNKNPVAV
ncbi:MAG: hypothetical protein AAF362_20740 [Pseudomonadota bacterium]